MRTKTLLLTAILSAAGMASSFAQGVYSVNVVGYVTVTLTNAGKYSILANPLITSNNHVRALIPSAPPNSQILKLGADGRYSPTIFDEFDLTWTFDLELPLGEGFFFLLPADAPGGTTTITFVGEVAQREASNKEIPGAFTNDVRFLSLQGSMVPQAGSINTVLQIPGEPLDQILRMLPDGRYQSAVFDEFDLVWAPDMSLNVAEGFFGKFAAPHQWNRNFVVPTP